MEAHFFFMNMAHVSRSWRDTKPSQAYIGTQTSR
jgi:hypothetical protein